MMRLFPKGPKGLLAFHDSIDVPTPESAAYRHGEHQIQRLPKEALAHRRTQSSGQGYLVCDAPQIYLAARQMVAPLSTSTIKAMRNSGESTCVSLKAEDEGCETLFLLHDEKSES